MNARRRNKDVPWPRRVYERSGTFWWVRPTDEQWIRLSRVEEGETKMLERLAEEKRKIEIDPNAGNVRVSSISTWTRTNRNTRNRFAWNGAAAASR